MDRFGIFSDWVNTEIIRKMKQDKFQIDFSASQIEEYLEHVRAKDPAKAKKYREAWNKQILHKEVANMFVKTAQNHAVFQNTHEGTTTKNSIKPRLINCPSFTIRARIGMISYYTLKFLKQNLPEFFMGKSPQQIEETIKHMQWLCYTY